MAQRKRLTKEERKDLREHYRSNIDRTLARIQVALDPTEHLELALGRLRAANNLATRALLYVEQIADDQEQLASLKRDVAAWAMVLTEMDTFETLADAKSRLKRIRNVLDNPVWQKEV